MACYAVTELKAFWLYHATGGNSGGTMKCLRLAAVFLSVLLVIDLVEGAETPRYGGRLVFGLSRDISALNPFFRTRSTNKYVRQIAYETLFDYDDKDRLVSLLGEFWTASPDSKVYTIKVRRGVKFHNGADLTAEDVKWSAEYAMDPKNAATGVNFLGRVQAVSIKDKFTVEFVLKEPQAIFINLLASIEASFPVVPKDSVPSGQREPSAPPPGTGPFEFKEYKAAREMIFARNKNYWQKGLPYLDELVLKPVEDEQVRFAALRAGDLNIIERTPYAFIKKIRNREIPEIRFVEAKDAGLRRLIFNVANPPFNNLKLRQAVLYALDKKSYVDAAYWGLGEPTNHGIPKDSRWYIKMPDVKRDVAKVKALLKEAKVGPDFELELLARRGEEPEIQPIQDQLTTAGIKTKVTILESGAREARTRAGDFMIVLSGFDVPNEPGDDYPTEYGCNDEEVTNKRRGQNQAGYCNKEFDRLMVEAAKIQDAKKRYELYAKALGILNDEIPDISLAFVPRYFTHQPKVMGFTSDSKGRLNMVSAGLSRVWLAP
ncbi:MAG: ABC transporter substrate-binding protein [Deltaproteobacteria bacterium]|nr:MAG: ABC transporter substrate-binding protein [Deltaproteobacteria bacterium]